MYIYKPWAVLPNNNRQKYWVKGETNMTSVIPWNSDSKASALSVYTEQLHEPHSHMTLAWDCHKYMTSKPMLS